MRLRRRTLCLLRLPPQRHRLELHRLEAETNDGDEKEEDGVVGLGGGEKEDDFEAVRAGSVSVWSTSIALTEHPLPSKTKTLLPMNHEPSPFCPCHSVSGATMQFQLLLRLRYWRWRQSMAAPMGR